MSKSTDVAYGRAGGRIQRWAGWTMAELLKSGQMVRVRCNCPVRAYFVEPNKVGKPCSRCGHKFQ